MNICRWVWGLVSLSTEGCNKWHSQLEHKLGSRTHYIWWCSGFAWPFKNCHRSFLVRRFSNCHTHKPRKRNRNCFLIRSANKVQVWCNCWRFVRVWHQNQWRQSQERIYDNVGTAYTGAAYFYTIEKNIPDVLFSYTQRVVHTRCLLYWHADALLQRLRFSRSFYTNYAVSRVFVHISWVSIVNDSSLLDRMIGRKIHLSARIFRFRFFFHSTRQQKYTKIPPQLTRSPTRPENKKKTIETIQRIFSIL